MSIQGGGVIKSKTWEILLTIILGIAIGYSLILVMENFKMILLIIIGWLACAALAAAIFIAESGCGGKNYDPEFYRENLCIAWLVGLLGGPLTVIIAIFLSGFCQHGFLSPFSLKPPRTR